MYPCLERSNDGKKAEKVQQLRVNAVKFSTTSFSVIDGMLPKLDHM